MKFSFTKMNAFILFIIIIYSNAYKSSVKNRIEENGFNNENKNIRNNNFLQKFEESFKDMKLSLPQENETKMLINNLKLKKKNNLLNQKNSYLRRSNFLNVSKNPVNEMKPDIFEIIQVNKSRILDKNNSKIPKENFTKSIKEDSPKFFEENIADNLTLNNNSTFQDNEDEYQNKEIENSIKNHTDSIDSREKVSNFNQTENIVSKENEFNHIFVNPQNVNDNKKIKKNTTISDSLNNTLNSSQKMAINEKKSKETISKIQDIDVPNVFKHEKVDVKNGWVSIDTVLVIGEKTKFNKL